MSLEKPRKFKEKCAKCSAALRSNTVSARYIVCNKGLYPKCISVPKALNLNDQWKCGTCTKPSQKLQARSNVYQLPGSTNSILCQPQRAASWNKLKTYQWNADGIYLKFPELRDLLINFHIVFLAAKESKLRKADKTPFVEGCNSTKIFQ